MAHSRSGVLAALLLPAALAGCGAQTAADDAKGTVARFQEALAAGDGTAACALLDGSARRAVAEQEQAPCRAAIHALDVAEGSVAGGEAAITNAKVSLSSGESAFLERTGAGWRITAIGCRPVPGRAQQRPFDCEVES